MPKTQVPAVEGLFTLDFEQPHLIGEKGKSRGSYFFPKHLAGSDPACVNDEELEEVLLSRTGKIWSYTASNYPPPLPYVGVKDPWEPFVLAAVELKKEKIVILGQMTEATKLEDVSVGSEVELVLETLYEDDENEYMVWKWRLI